MPKSVTVFSDVIQCSLRLIGIPEVSCLDLVRTIALNLSGLTFIELVLNQSIAKFDLVVNRSTNPGIVSLTADMMLSSAKLWRSFEVPSINH